MQLSPPRTFSTGVVATAWQPRSFSYDCASGATTVMVGLYLSQEMIENGGEPIATEPVVIDSDATARALGGANLNITALVVGLLTPRAPFTPT